MTIANKITYTRFVLALISFVLLLSDYWKTGSVILLVAVLLDIADGIIARTLKQESIQGIFLDILVDKVVIISTFLIIGFKINSIFFYLGILMLIREYSIDSFRTLASTKRIVLVPDKLSKIKGIVFMVSMLGMVFNKALLNYEYVYLISIYLAILVMIFAYYSLIRVFLKNRTVVMK
ncbi:MAG: CDP-alcohol phosphatidyltransferase family protein [Candidatus Woesearchaeota archaeon]|nr:CDP-alcohol phosphatidyltransferase family protein [Candidatus Woesearchaeota archaeon]